MNIGITGATGFIGSLLVEKHLKLGDNVHILSRKGVGQVKNVHYHVGDLLDKESLISFVSNVDVLYHCAAEINNTDNMQAINVLGTENLIESAAGNIKHWVQLSSVGVYGPIYDGVVFENQAYNPINEYEKTKLESDFLVQEAAKSNKFTLTIIRPSNVFGQSMRNQSLFDLIKTVDKGYYFFVGDKGASANYVTVENVVEALYLGAVHPAAINQIYTISAWCTIEDFIKMIAENLNKPVPMFRVPARPIELLANCTSWIPKNPLTISRVKALTNRSIYTTAKIESELNFKPINSVVDGVLQMVIKYKNSKIKD